MKANSANSVHVEINVHVVDHAIWALTSLIQQLAAARGKPVDALMNDDYLYNMAGGSTPAQDIANLQRIADYGRAQAAQQKGGGL